MKDWPAFIELKNKIDDFNQTCPLLELMADKAMKDRHWRRLEALMGGLSHWNFIVRITVGFVEFLFLKK